MRAGRTTYVVILGGLLAWPACNRFAGKDGGGHAHVPRDRDQAIVLVDDGGTCKPIKVDPIRAYRQEKQTWHVYNYCGSQYTDAKIDFTSSNDPDNPVPYDPSPQLEQAFGGNKEAKLFLKVKDFSDQVPSSGFWSFTYALSVKKGGVWQPPFTDPQFEVDP
jgi:hypothetical protein